MKKQKRSVPILGIIVVIIIVVIGVFVVKKVASNDNKSSGADATEQLEENKQIRINEDFSKNGTIENLNNVRWNNVMINQFDKKMDVSISLNNESETETIPEKDLTVNLLDKEGNIIFTQDVHMDAMSAPYGYTTLDLTFDIEDIVVIYDVQIIAK